MPYLVAYVVLFVVFDHWFFASLVQAKRESAVEHALKHADQNYACPMHPRIVKSEPGLCPICGMDLISVERGAGDGDQYPAVSIKASVVQNMGIRTAKVARRLLEKKIRTVGQIEYNEDTLSHIHSREEGWVEKLHVRSKGEMVLRGSTLLEYYSPNILTAQKEYLVALRTNTDLVSSAEQRLSLLGVPNDIIDNIRRSGKSRHSIPIRAPQSGLVAKIGLREGMYIKPSLELYTLAKLSDVWVQVYVFEHQLDWVKIGRKAEIHVAALPDRNWKGEIDYIYPELDPITHTLKVRLRFANGDGTLKPNMYADVVIEGGFAGKVLTVPREAVILSGQVARVIKQIGEGEFQPKEVKLGAYSQGRIEVLEGLDAGDVVVVSGQFLIDSESNLQTSLRRFGKS